MILCRATASAKELGTSYIMAVIYADLEGNAELSSLKDFDFSEFTDGDGTSITDADSMMIVTIYEDPDGKSELSNIHLLDLADFTDQ